MHAKRPRPAFHVPRIFPYGLHAAFEEMDGIPHPQVLQRELVEQFPEGLDGDDILEHGRETLFVRGRGIGRLGGLFVVEAPGVAEGWGPDFAVHVEAEFGAVGGVVGGGRGGSGFGDIG